MIETIIKAIFWDAEKKKIKYYTQIVEEIKKKEEEFAKFSLDDVKKKTQEFRDMFSWLDFENPEDSKKIKEILKEILVPAFANLKTATKLINSKEFELPSWKKLLWNMIPYDVQLIWWMTIHDWQISEMKTWEWKTLVATLPAYLNALSWNPVHIVTVNDYLARRDSEEMWVLYNALWLSVWVITHNQNPSEKKDNYSRDIVYATNNEMWFDYLRDNMVTKLESKVMSRPFFAIIDEVDSILIDEARTPLIISMPDSEPTSKYLQFATLSKTLDNWVDYKIDEKQRTATLTESWIEKIEKMLWVENIYVSERYNDLHHIENALKARAVYKKDKDYLVSPEWEVLIIDEHTWRVLSWRRYSDWLHQAIEAKEGVEIKKESKTLASITFQNYFRMYWKLAWMTWTAKTEEEEFYKVYALETLVIPTNRPIARVDKSDLLFKNEKWKYDYTVKLIKECYEKWQPVLVWTISVEKSEYLSDRLKQEKIPHNVLNAKEHLREAEIVAEAGQFKAVTIATNMAWRWTDIKLWEWVRELGWLYIIWTEKHETRRIDNQLRWRAWRQWDPWVTQFLISPNDEIMRIFGWDKLFWIFNSPAFASLPDDEPLAQSSMLTKRVTSVQKQVEWHNFDARKHVLEYDDVINKHREIIYSKRNKILKSENIDEDIKKMILSQIIRLIWSILINDDYSRWDLEDLREKVNEFIGSEIVLENDENIKNFIEVSEVSNYIYSILLEKISEIRKNFEKEEDFFELERRVVLQTIDELWMMHIDSMSKLRESVAFEWYAQRQPLVVYKEKAFDKFGNLMWEIEFKTTKAMFSIKKNIEVKQIELNENNFVVTTQEELENSKINQTSNSNPLFAQPKSQSWDAPKKRIRV